MDVVTEEQLHAIRSTLEVLRAEGVVARWREFPAIGLFALYLIDERGRTGDVVLTADQVEAFIVGARAGLQAGKSSGDSAGG